MIVLRYSVSLSDCLDWLHREHLYNKHLFQKIVAYVISVELICLAKQAIYDFLIKCLETECLMCLQNTSSMDNQIKHLVYLLENAMLNLPPGQEQMAWLIDFTGWSITNNVPLKSARETISILQNHYPERLGIAFLYNPPRIFEAFWKVCYLFSP